MFTTIIETRHIDATEALTVKRLQVEEHPTFAGLLRSTRQYTDAMRDAYNDQGPRAYDKVEQLGYAIMNTYGYTMHDRMQEIAEEFADV